ncbi:MAG TPA: hypothetical protein VNA69_15905 [Thermoanaerobaculia bacterium]|nr:hypothetical protein [Thermoanaerobaculia bacterium]
MLRIGEVAWYVTGRFYAKGSTALDVGYFLHLQGVEGDLFDGAPGEATAYFTFSAEPFEVRRYTNAGLPFSLSERGEFGIFLKETPGSSFDDPDSFATGQRIAAFRRVSVVVGVSIIEPAPGASPAMNVFTADLVWSCPFRFRDREYDLAQLIPNGITQWGTAVPQAGESAVPFVGSAIAVG